MTSLETTHPGLLHLKRLKWISLCWLTTLFVCYYYFPLIPIGILPDYQLIFQFKDRIITVFLQWCVIKPSSKQSTMIQSRYMVWLVFYELRCSPQMVTVKTVAITNRCKHMYGLNCSSRYILNWVIWKNCCSVQCALKKLILIWHYWHQNSLT